MEERDSSADLDECVTPEMISAGLAALQEYAPLGDIDENSLLLVGMVREVLAAALRHMKAHAIVPDDRVCSGVHWRPDQPQARRIQPNLPKGAHNSIATALGCGGVELGSTCQCLGAGSKGS